MYFGDIQIYWRLNPDGTHSPFPDDDPIEAVKYMANSKEERRLALDQLIDEEGEMTTVVTTFLVIDHAVLAPFPVLWETYVYRREHEFFQRYSSIEEARVGHEGIVNMLKEGTEWRE
jgi:hypothetical protein